MAVKPAIWGGLQAQAEEQKGESMCYNLVEWLKEKLPHFYGLKPIVVAQFRKLLNIVACKTMKLRGPARVVFDDYLPPRLLYLRPKKVAKTGSVASSCRFVSLICGEGSRKVTS